MPLLRRGGSNSRVEEDLQGAAKKSGETFFCLQKVSWLHGEYYQTKKEDGHYHTNGDYYYGSLKTGVLIHEGWAGLDYSREKWTCYLSNYTILKQRKLLLDDGKNVLSFCLENSFILERPRTSNLENVVLLPIKTVGLLVPNNMGIKMTQ